MSEYINRLEAAIPYCNSLEFKKGDRETWLRGICKAADEIRNGGLIDISPVAVYALGELEK
jgi:hypothetical protein